MSSADRPDYGALPTYAFGPRSTLYWGTLGFIVIEGLGFVFTIAAYLYLASQNRSWPLSPPPDLLWGSLLLGLMLLSEVPNIWTRNAALARNATRVRIGVAIMSLIGIALMALRVFEYTTLNVRWDSNAYGSIVWVLLSLHSAHLMTDVVETVIILVLLFDGPMQGKRFAIVEDNQNYWDFVVLSWVPIYLTLYWLPRWLEGG
jgi:heme/copper-type cytochrome/quinol oxidase subunit 3